MKFIHITHTDNLGDKLCCPKYYFDCIPGKSDTIIGGGVQTKLILARESPPSNSILWGAGCTGRVSDAEKADCDDFLAWGIRDKSLVQDDRNFLPCVSALHPMLDLPKPEQEKTLLHINADPRIYSISSLHKVKRLALDKNALFITNRAPEKDFIDCLAKSSHIITSSYHGAYWGLLSGRTVTLMGYSYKFKSLLNILNLKEYFIPFKKGDQKTLLQATKQAFDQTSFHELKNHKEILNQFRKKQLDFATMLESKNILRQCKIKSFDSKYIVQSKQKSEILALSKYYTMVGLRNLKAKIKNQ